MVVVLRDREGIGIAVAAAMSFAKLKVRSVLSSIPARDQKESRGRSRKKNKKNSLGRRSTL